MNELGLRYDTDKSGYHHNYLDKYEFFLRNYKDEKDVKLLELGVFKGASLKAWSKYFPNAIVYGVDIDEECRKYEGDNRKILITDLGDVKNLNRLKYIHPDIIVDDVSHLWSHQIKALLVLFDSLHHGGAYILEDLGVCFNLYKDGVYNDSVTSSYEVLRAIEKVVASHEALDMQYENPNLIYYKDIIDEIGRQIDMIFFIHESCIIIKK